MPARLIINADDFGLTPGINRAIAELHAAGVLTSATLMANGPAFHDAAATARAHPTLGVGCHIVLTDGIPVCNPQDIPTLMGSDRHSVRPSLSAFVRALLLHQIHEDDIEREALAQIRKLQHAGIHPTHVDSHKHTHIFPAVARPLLRAAAKAGVRAIRYPFEPRAGASVGRQTTPLLRRAQLKVLRTLQPRFRQLLHGQRQILTTSGTFGISATGTLDAGTLRQILSLPAHNADDVAFELCCHPGYNDSDLDRVATRLRVQRDTEREALLAVVPEILASPNPPQLIHYGDV